MLKTLALFTVLIAYSPEDRVTVYEGKVHTVAKGHFYLKCANGNDEYFPVEKRTRYYLDGQEVRFDQVKVGLHGVAIWKGNASEGHTVEIRIKTR